jgi:hypothetical protein
MPKKQQRGEMTVTKTISLPFTVLEQVMDEAEVMGKNFSEATAVLLRIGIAQRRIMREEERKDQEAMTRLGMKQV